MLNLWDFYTPMEISTWGGRGKGGRGEGGKGGRGEGGRGEGGGNTTLLKSIIRNSYSKIEQEITCHRGH